MSDVLKTGKRLRMRVDFAISNRNVSWIGAPCEHKYCIADLVKALSHCKES